MIPVELEVLACTFTLALTLTIALALRLALTLILALVLAPPLTRRCSHAPASPRRRRGCSS